jgi:hypothetical protein
MKSFLIIVSCISILLFSCTFKKKENVNTKNSVVLEQPKNIIDSFVLAYLDVKDALMSDTLANVIAKENVFAIQLNIIKSDLNINKDSSAVSIEKLQNAFTEMKASKTVETKLKQFQYFTTPISILVSKHSTYKLYTQKCPMAEKYSIDSNVYWLSKDKKIKNPFFPHTMPNCGVVVDTINSKP